MDYSLISSSLQESKAAAKRVKSKKKKKKIKVVYISNPMKVKTSASKFRALVQQLTGQHAEDLPADPTKTTDTANDDVDVGGGGRGDDNQTVRPDVGNSNISDNHIHAQDQDVPFDDDDVFTPQIVGSFPGFLPLALLL